MNFSAVILAGGKSLRMGRDKAWLEVEGKSLLARQIELVRGIGATEVFISGRADTDYSAFGCPVLQDRFVDAGPLAGIERGLAATVSPLLLVLAVDLPRINRAMLEKLRAACTEQVGTVPRVNGNIEPLVGFYPKAAHPEAEYLLSNGSNSVSAFSSRCVQSGLATFLDVAEEEGRCFENWNSPTDLKMIL